MPGTGEYILHLCTFSKSLFHLVFDLSKREGAANFAKANNIDHVGGKKFKRYRLKQKTNSLLSKVNKETKPPPAYHLSPMMKKKAILPGRKAFVTIVESFHAPIYDFNLTPKEKVLLRTVFEPPKW